MAPITRLLRDAVAAAPRERVLIDLACVVLCVVGAVLIGAAVFHVLADAAGVQAARLVTGAAAFALAGIVWAIGAIRARRRNRRAAAARARLTEEAGTAALARAHLAGPAVAFAVAFLTGRKL